MTTRDRRGLAVTAADATAIERFDDALHLFNGYYMDPLAAIDAVIAEHPDFVMAHCFRAAMFMLSTERGAEGELRRSLAAAERLAVRANARERGHMAALRAWLEGDFIRAGELYNAVLIDHPRDLLALQAGHQIDFFMGNAVQLRDRVARVMPSWNEHVPGFGFVLGMHAFGLEETNLYRRAENAGRLALALNPRDPWAVHAVAHVMEMEGRQADGIRWLTDRKADWATGNMFAYHNWWHLALFHLDLGQTARVLELYDGAIRPQPSPAALETLDATALLWRLHLRGVDVGARWKDLADTWEPMAGDAYYAFNDMHAMMAFMADRRTMAARRLMSALERRVDEGGTNAALTRDIGLPICRAIKAFSEGDYESTITMLCAVRPIAHRFGGSHAQRDVLNLTLLEAALRAKRVSLARALAAERTEFKPSSPFNWASTARALDLMGETMNADQARARAMSLAA